MYIVTAGEMQTIDRQTIESFGIPGRVLMENAGLGATRVLFDTFPGVTEKRVGIIAGRGNNGGDGFVIARYLSHKGVDVTVYLLSTKDKVKGDAASNLVLLEPLGIPVCEIPDRAAFNKHKSSLLHQNIWVDAIFGTGLNSEVKGFFREIIEFVNSTGKPVFAVDIPSGLDADTGRPCGVCIQARATATFAYAKTGHHLFPGADYTGTLSVIEIGIPPLMAEKVNPRQYLLTKKYIRSCLKPRPADTHKGSAGHVLVVAGSIGKTGAAAMTAISAMRAGAGLVTLGIPESLNAAIEPMVLETMTCPLPEKGDGMLDASSFNMIMDLLSDKKCLAIGPGIGTTDSVKELVRQILQACRVPVVIDADGLNCLVGNVDILNKMQAPVIVTPHPGEMARLAETTTTAVQSDRVTCARKFAESYNAHVVLKGAGTVIAHPDGRVFINRTGNSGMASGGMGDVLTGIIAGFVAQGYPPESAAHTGVYLHGAAADALAKTAGPIGFLASDIMACIPEQINCLGQV